MPEPPQIACFRYAETPRPPRLEAGEIHLWLIPVEGLRNALERHERLLSPEERGRASAFRFAEDAVRYVLSHGALRLLYGGYNGIRPECVRPAVSAYGKPFVRPGREDRPLYFNLSHSGDFALCAFSRDREVGVDIERVRAFNDLHSLAEFVLHPDEAAALASLPETKRLAGFFELWTKKEAFVKGLGKGLSYLPNSFSVPLGVSSGTVRCAATEGFWGFHAFQPATAYTAAVAFPLPRLAREAHLGTMRRRHTGDVATDLRPEKFETAR